MAKRIKAKDFEVEDPEVAMARFKAGLRKLVQVPKSAIEPKRKVKKKKA